MLEWAPLCKFWCHKNTFANQFDRLSISSIESSWSRHCRNFVQGLQPRKVHEKGAKIFGQLTILDSSCMQLESSTDIQSPCTDMVGPEQKKRHSCDSNPHFTDERFFSPRHPTKDHFMVSNSWLNSFCAKSSVMGNISQKWFSPPYPLKVNLFLLALQASS